MKALMLLAVYEGFSGAKRGVRSVLMRTVPSRRADAVGSSGPKSREDPSAGKLEVTQKKTIRNQNP